MRPFRGEILLASTSPRRRKLLRLAGIPFRTVQSTIDEGREFSKSKRPAYRAEYLAVQKVLGVAKRYPHDFILGADTIVVIQDQIFGKPKEEVDARRMLFLLSGRWHEVLTGVAVACDKKTFSGLERTRVKFRRLSRSEVDTYIASGEPMDKAGAYAIQGGARDFVESIRGDYTNVVGLPLNLAITLLAKLVR